MSAENLEVVRALLDAIGRDDIDGALELVHPDGEWVNPSYAMEPGTRRGLGGVRIAFEALRGSFAELRADIDELVDLDDRVLLVGTFSGVGRASDVAFGPQPFGSLITLVDGLVLRYEWFLDPDEARQAAGV